MIATEVIPMHSAYIVTGTLTDAQTVSLDEALPLTQTRVRVVVEPLLSASPRQYQEIMAEIHERQRTRGHKPPHTTRGRRLFTSRARQLGGMTVRLYLDAAPVIYTVEQVSGYAAAVARRVAPTEPPRIHVRGTGWCQSWAF